MPTCLAIILKYLAHYFARAPKYQWQDIWEHEWHLPADVHAASLVSVKHKHSCAAGGIEQACLSLHAELQTGC